MQLSLFEPVEIPLTQGFATLIDPVDADLLKHKWRVNRCLHKDWIKGIYACRAVGPRGGQKLIHLHRVIMERLLGRLLSPTEFVDHIDGNGLNNTRSNLRLATRNQNGQNAKKPRNNTSGFKGVYWHRAARKWKAEIVINAKPVYLGLFDTPEAAYTAYCEAARKHFGEFARFE